MDDISPADILRPQEFVSRFPNLVTSVAALRYQIFMADSNGLTKARAIVRRGRNVYVIAPRYVSWVLGQSDPARPRTTRAA